ncbi:DUF1294 domain-containing protein [Microbulbifer flavimaris]|uniref:DUF1294 domain-containing protein n=1 Tax=Microbulbifer flavimaris TaxID=1781068 RepID=A0ABX4HW86_9GAMM|nr:MULTISPECIES: DUF1294 domain-containing protein [Microbulbifer]PCO04370.1 DUF1294 domain-containing protein [Microbulbifer flavimaris]
MEYKGSIASWDDGRGYGFIQPEGGGSRVFLHVSAFDRRYCRPEQGMAVRFSLGRDDRGRPRADSARPANAKRSPNRPGRQRRRALPLVGVFFAGLAGLSVWGWLPWSITGLYLALSLLTLLLYFKDKRAAVRGHWRTPEQTLHLLSLLGGWPGAALGQSLLRHKSRKGSFRMVYWLTVGLNLAALGYGLTAEGQQWLHQLDSFLMRIPANL